MDDQNVVRSIEEAFAACELPPALELVNDHCSECIETYREFCSAPHTFMTWQAAASRPGARVEAALLSPRAWRYYLPALMVWCVRDTKRVDVLLDNLVHELTPPGSANQDWFGPRSVGFTADQRNAIVCFLEWYRRREKAEWASIGKPPPDDAAGAIRFWSGGS